MANLLEAEAKSGIGSSHKAVINLFLPGGPPHQDMWDLKMDAPREIRGEFKPISTNVPGTQICELFPRLAKMMDKFTVIRSIVGATGAHDADQCMTGRTKKNEPPGGWPSIGSILSKLEGPTNPDTPPFPRPLPQDRRDSLERPRQGRLPRAGARGVPTVRRGQGGHDAQRHHPRAVE